MKYQLTLVCFLCCIIGIVLVGLTDANWIVGSIMSFIFGLVLGWFTVHKKIVEDE